MSLPTSDRPRGPAPSHGIYKCEDNSASDSRSAFLTGLPPAPLPLPADDSGPEREVADCLFSEDPSAQADALAAMSAILRAKDRILPEPLLARILECAASPIEALADRALEALYLVLSFDSPMHIFLIEHGILELASSRFPGRNAFCILQNLALTVRGRAEVLETGILGLLIALLPIADEEKVGDCAHFLSCITYDIGEFNFDPHIDNIIELFTQLMLRYNASNAELCREIVQSARDSVAADHRFRDYFVSHNFLNVLLTSAIRDDGWAERVARLMEALCDARMHDHVSAAGGVGWAESHLLSPSGDLVRRCYSFFDAYVSAGDGAEAADAVVAIGVAEQAMYKFEEPDANFRTREAILEFLSGVAARASRGALRELIGAGVFALVYRHWSCLPFPRLLAALVRVAALPGADDAEMVAEMVAEIREDAELDEAISEAAHSGDPWASQARLVSEIIWTEWEELDDV